MLIPNGIKILITKKTKAIIAVDLGGFPADYLEIKKIIESDEIKRLFNSNNDTQKKLGRIALISDAAHSIGAEYYGGKTGNYADMRFLYLSLRKNHRLQEYLHYYPEQYKLFDWYTTLLYDYTHFLHSMYKECYISKTKSLREYPDEIRTHMFKLHEIYINTYRGNNRSITIKDTINYINDLDVPLLFTTMFR